MIPSMREAEAWRPREEQPGGSGHVRMNTKCGNEVSQLLLHVSKRKRRRRTAGKIHIFSPPGTSQSSKESRDKHRAKLWPPGRSRPGSLPSSAWHP